MMFPMPMPPMPPEIMDAAAANPAGFADALATGMEAFQGAMGDGGDMGAAFEAMGDVMGPIMQDMGVSPEAFEAAGDAVGAAIGGGMHMAPADCGGAEMGAICQDAVEMMMPPGTEVPAPVMDAMGDMGQGLADAGCMPHDVADMCLVWCGTTLLLGIPTAVRLSPCTLQEVEAREVRFHCAVDA